MKWFTYICSEKHDDTPFEATKGGETYWWTISVDLPQYDCVEWASVSTLSEAKQYWLNAGYAFVEPEIWR